MWHYVVDVGLPIIGTVAFAWACIKQIKAVVIGAAVLTVVAYAWWYGPGSSLLAPAAQPDAPAASRYAPSPRLPDKAARPDTVFIPHPNNGVLERIDSVGTPAQQAAGTLRQHCYSYSGTTSLITAPANLPANLDPAQPADWCDPPVQVAAAGVPPAQVPATPPPPSPAAQTTTRPACVERPPIRNTFYLCAGSVPNPTEITPGTPSAEQFLKWFARTHPQWADLAKASSDPRPIGMPFDAQTPEAPTLCKVPPPQRRSFYYCDDYGRLNFAVPTPGVVSSDNFLVWYEKTYPQYAAQVRALRAGTLH